MFNSKIAAGLAAMFALGVLVSAPARAADSVMKDCGVEWKAAKTNKTTNGQTWKQFLADCRTRHASATPAPAPTAAAAAPAPAAPAPKPTKMSKMAPAAAAAAPAAGQFTTEALAKGHCPSDTIVWVNNNSHKYHYSGDRYYGATKHGGFMCETEAKSSGDVAVKTRAPKS